MPAIDQAKVLIMATDGFEQTELTGPLERLKERGAQVDVAAPEKGRIRGWDHVDWGEYVPVDLTLDEVDVSAYDALILPGGQINPDKLRVDAAAMKIVTGFLNADKVVAAICHAPWLLIQADAAKGRRMTSYHSIVRDVENAGAEWVDQPVVVDGKIVTSRKPDDVPAFVEKIVEMVEGGGGQARLAPEI